MPGSAPPTARVRARRFRSQLLGGPQPVSPVDVVERLLAVQGQDFRGARLAIRARSRGLHADDVHAELTDKRSLLITWLNRGTLHLVRAEDYWWLQPLVTPPLATGNARRLAQEGVSPDAADLGVRTLVAALDSGPRTRAELREELVRAGVPVAGQALIHILLRASLHGLVVRGPVVDGEQSFVLVRDWLGPAPPPRDRGVALADLAYRYLAGHGPASARDLARWSGLPLRDARAGFAAISGRVHDWGDGLLATMPPGAASRTVPSPRLLGAFDPLLLGWSSRADIVGRYQNLVTDNGLFRAFLLVGGRAVGTWSLSGGAVAITAFEPLTAAAEQALRRDARAVERFLSPS